MSDKKTSSELLSAQESAAFSLWNLPSFDAPEADHPDPEETEAETASVADVEPEVRVEEVVAEDVKPLTLEDVEAVRQDAWNEGFSTGEKDGFHAGQLKATQEADAVLAAKVQTLENIMREFFEPIASQDQQLEESMLQMVMEISRQVIQRELKTDSSQIKQVVREALKLLPLGSESVRVYVNPQDFEQIKALRERHEENWKILEDEDLLPGGCRFESVNTQINATIETRIEHIAAQILDQQRELQSQPLAPDLDVDLHAPIVTAAADLDIARESAARSDIAEPEPEPEPATATQVEQIEPVRETSVTDTAIEQPADQAAPTQ